MRATTLFISAALMLCSTSVFAQSSYNVVIEPVSPSIDAIIHAPVEYDDNGVVKAQHFNADNLTDEEYQRVVDEANRIRAYRDANDLNFEDQYVYTDSAATTTYETDSSYQLELFAPETSTASAATTTTSAAKTHTVSRGETLYSISKLHGVTIPAIQAENGIATTTLSIGQRIRIPGVIVETFNTAASRQTFASAPPRDGFVTRRVIEPAPSIALPQVENVGSSEAIYAVLPKDTLYSISRRTCIGVKDIIARNEIANPNSLTPGQRITVPSGHCLYR